MQTLSETTSDVTNSTSEVIHSNALYPVLMLMIHFHKTMILRP
jgi:hypothetical protein